MTGFATAIVVAVIIRPRDTTRHGLIRIVAQVPKQTIRSTTVTDKDRNIPWQFLEAGDRTGERSTSCNRMRRHLPFNDRGTSTVDEEEIPDMGQADGQPTGRLESQCQSQVLPVSLLWIAW
jgi:hypothetical protein